MLQLLDGDDPCLATLAALQTGPDDEHGRAHDGDLVPLATTIGALGDVLTTNKGILRRAPLTILSPESDAHEGRHLGRSCSGRPKPKATPVRGGRSRRLPSHTAAVQGVGYRRL